MRGFWHITAIATCASIISVIITNVSLLIVVLLWLLSLKLLGRLNTLPFLVSLAALIFFTYYIPTHSYISSDKMDNSNIRLTGKVTSPVEQTPKKLQFTLRQAETQEKYLIIFFKKDVNNFKSSYVEQIKFGSTCSVVGKTNLPKRARNPGQFDFYKYLVDRGIKTQVIVSSLDKINCHGASIFHPIFKLRQFLLQNLEKITTGTTAAWIQALVLGDRDYLPEQTVDLFQRWGLSHILAISGLHIGIIVASIYFIFVRCGFLTKETTEWLLIGFLPIYTIIAGGEPSVLRASLMIIIFLIVNKIKLSLHLQDTISIVFILLIIFNPLVVYHIGFQFSFLVTFALILSRYWLTRMTSSSWQLLIISYVSQMIILPLQFHYFHTFQPLSIIVNFFIVPYFSLVVIPLMFLLLPLLFTLPFVAKGLIIIFEPLHNIMIKILFLIDQYLYVPIVLGDFPLLAAVIYYIAFVFSIKFIERQQFKRAFQYSLTFVVLIIALTLRPYFSPEGTITMLDVGQGDAFVIELPYRRGVFFIDAAANVSFNDFAVTHEVYERTIKPFLYSRGIQKVDAIILSHAHVDHNGSSQYIIDDFNTPLLIVSEYYEFREDEKKFLDDKNIRIFRLKGNQSFTLNGHTFDVLSPLANEHDTDDNSLVLHSTFGKKEWVFTGDISKAIERKITTQYKDKTIDVLKVAHHGSKTSTEPSFIEHFQPTYALISVGENNIYGHPHAEVLHTLEGEDVHILRTDEHGAVQYIFTEESGTFYTFLP